MNENFAHFCLKQPRNRFSEKYAYGSFLRNCPPHLFSGPNGLWCVVRKNCHGRKLCSLLPKTAQKLFFRKIRFQFVFTKLPPSPIFRAKRLCGAFRSEIVTYENFACLCLKRPRNRFSENHVSGLFLRNRPPHLFSGQKWTMWWVSRRNCHG